MSLGGTRFLTSPAGLTFSIQATADPSFISAMAICVTGVALNAVNRYRFLAVSFLAIWRLVEDIADEERAVHCCS